MKKIVILIFAAVLLISCTSEAAQKQEQIITQSETTYAEEITAEDLATRHLIF